MVAPVGFQGRTNATALVPVSRPATIEAEAVETPPRAAPFIGRRADFLAHLVAIREDAAQTRARRRAEPAEALAVYAAMPVRLRQDPCRDLASA